MFCSWGYLGSHWSGQTGLFFIVCWPKSNIYLKKGPNWPKCCFSTRGQCTTGCWCCVDQKHESHRISHWAATFPALHFGDHATAWSSKMQRVGCHAGLRGFRWEMEKLWAPLSSPLGAPTPWESQHTSTSSWSLTPHAAAAIWTRADLQPLLMMIFFMLPCSASAMAQHSGWAPALKVGSWILAAFSHHGATPCIISKDWYLLPTPSAWCFLSGPTAWHAFARNPEQFPSPFRWLCFEYWEFEHLPH